MNIAPLRKTILKETTIFTALIILLGGAIFYLTMLSNDLAQQKETASRVANQFLTEKQGMDKKFNSVKNHMYIYNESQGWIRKQGLFLDSQAVRDLFNYYQNTLFLKKVTVELQPINDASDGKYGGKHFIATRTTAKVTLEAITDEDVYRLVRTMQNDLPGFIKITSMNFTKREPLTRDVLERIRREGYHTLVTGEMTFEWYGLRSPDETSPMNKFIPRQYEGQAANATP